MMEGAALADRREYQDRLAEARRKGLPAAAAVVRNGTMAEQQLHQQVQQARKRCRELEQEKQQLQQQLLQQQHESCQELQAANAKTQQLQEQVSQILNTAIATSYSECTL